MISSLFVLLHHNITSPPVTWACTEHTNLILSILHGPELYLLYFEG